jgi:hypothetical protein
VGPGEMSNPVAPEELSEVPIEGNHTMKIFAAFQLLVCTAMAFGQEEMGAEQHHH